MTWRASCRNNRLGVNSARAEEELAPYTGKVQGGREGGLAWLGILLLCESHSIQECVTALPTSESSENFENFKTWKHTPG